MLSTDKDGLAKSKYQIAHLVKSRVCQFLETKKRLGVLVIVLLGASSFHWLLFERATNSDGAACATVLYEFHPTLVIVLLALLPKKLTTKPQDLSVPKRLPVMFRLLNNMQPVRLTLIAFSGLGVALVAASQTSDLSLSGAVENSLLGVSAAIMAALGTTLSLRLPSWIGFDPNETDKTTCASLYILLLRFVPGVIICFALVPLTGLPIHNFQWSHLTVPLLGGVVSSAGWYFYFRANILQVDDPSINSLYNVTPVLALLWLGLFASLDVLRVGGFAFGALTIITSNTLLHLDPEGAEGVSDAESHDKVRGWGYRALVLSTLCAGAFMYFRDEFLPQQWRAWTFQEFWGIVAVCATVFVLILSFRISRIAERTRSEDSLMLKLHRRAEHLTYENLLPACPGKALSEQTTNNPEPDVVSDRRHEHDTFCWTPDKEPSDRPGNTATQNGCDILWHLRQANRSTRTSHMASHYFAARRIIAIAIENSKQRQQLSQPQPDVNERDLRRELHDYQSDLDTFANLRLSGREFAEIVTMVIFGALTIYVALFLRPNTPDGTPTAWTGFATELISMALASAVAFLVFNLFDKQGERDTSIIRHVSRKAINTYGQPPGWRLNIAVLQDITWQRRISVTVIFAVITVITWLLHHKWF